MEAPALWIVMSFVGHLPAYTREAIHQVRLFYDGPLALITDSQAPLVSELRSQYGVTIVPYSTVRDESFDAIYRQRAGRFAMVDELPDRRELFVRSIERLYLLANFIKTTTERVSDVLFLEIDNLLYCDPRRFLESWRRRPLSYLFDHHDRFSSAVFYVHDVAALDLLLQFSTQFVLQSHEFLNEMTILARFYRQRPELVQILPSAPLQQGVPAIVTEQLGAFEGVFDASSIGIFLFGLHPLNARQYYFPTLEIKEESKNAIKGLRNPYAAIDYTRYEYRWRIDEQGRRLPSLFFEGREYPIWNLHIHAKNLWEALSRPLK